MHTYEVTVTLECTYTIDAPTEEIAMDIAQDYFAECTPILEVKEIIDND